MSKHTPGPWRDINRNEVWSDPEGRLVANCQPENVDLIAAAPDLLAALKFCALALDSHVDIERRTAREVIRAAIAKAEGTS